MIVVALAYAIVKSCFVVLFRGLLCGEGSAWWWLWSSWLLCFFSNQRINLQTKPRQQRQ